MTRWFLTSPLENRQEMAMAFAEAWAWLEREGLLVHKPGEGAAGWFLISRRGAKLSTREQVGAYRNGNLLPREQLHPSIAQTVSATFLRGACATAVFEAFREVEVAVRKAGGLGDGDLGVKLMRRAFDVAAGPLRDAERLEAERQAMSDLFAGAIGLLKIRLVIGKAR